MFGSSIRRGVPDRGARVVVAVLSALVLFVLAACSSSGSSGSGSTSGSASGSNSSGGAGNAEVAAAQKRLAPALTPVDKIPVDTPLTQKPPAGKSVVFIRYNNPTVAEYDQWVKQAAAALGWHVTITAIDATDPQAVSNAMLRAVSQHVDYILGAAFGIPNMGAGLKAAKDAGIPVFVWAGVGEPEGKANGLYGNTAANETLDGSLLLVDEMIVDSGATGSGLFVNAPDFPILAPLDDAMKKKTAEDCSGCSLDTLDISAGDLGGDIASQIVNAIRQHPDVKYVIASFDTLVTGLSQALAAAGMNDVKVYIQDPGASAVTQIERGDYAGAAVSPHEDLPWLAFDQIARVSVGMDPLQNEHATQPFQLWTTDKMPKGATGWAPPNLQDQYKQLWQIS